jgi:hypothetical protein
MSTVLRDGPYRFFWYSADRNERPHVHVERDHDTAKFWFDTIELAENKRFSSRELRRIQAIIETHRDEWLERWHREFGR